MKPEQFTDDQLRLAILDASDQRNIFISKANYLEDIGSLAIQSLRTLLAHLPEPVAEDWQECRFEDIRKGDRFKIEGRGWHYESTAVNVDVDVVCANPRTGSFVMRDDIDQSDELTLYRIPAPVTTPDPAEHPVVIDEAGRPWFSAGFDEYHSPHQHSVFRHPRDFANWSPAKVVADDER